MTVEMSITEFRDNAYDTINKVLYQDERPVLTRRGKAVAVVVPVEIGRLVERLLDAYDFDSAMDALADPNETWRDAEGFLEELGI